MLAVSSSVSLNTRPDHFSPSLSLCLQASVSLKRLRVFLSHEELQEDSVEHQAAAGCESL